MCLRKEPVALRMAREKSRGSLGRVLFFAYPTQVMVLTHELSALAECMPYFSCRLYPCRANLFFGRSAKRQPACPAAECVYHWFKEHFVFHVAAGPSEIRTVLGLSVAP